MGDFVVDFVVFSFFLFDDDFGVVVFKLVRRLNNGVAEGFRDGAATFEFVVCHCRWRVLLFSMSFSSSLDRSISIISAVFFLFKPVVLEIILAGEEEEIVAIGRRFDAPWFVF